VAAAVVVVTDAVVGAELVGVAEVAGVVVGTPAVVEPGVSSGGSVVSAEQPMTPANASVSTDNGNLRAELTVLGWPGR
jgi:hypothetical protein